MTNTIPNVPRELLCELRDAANEGMNATTRQHQIDHFAGLIAKADALLSDPSPAGVDGLNTDRNAAFKACPESGCDWGSFYLGWKARGSVDQAIIDGLRGEVADLRSMLATVSKAGLRVRTERDQHAQRIGELEGLLRDSAELIKHGVFEDGYCCCGSSVDSHGLGDGHSPVDALAYHAGQVCERIDAALSAGKEGA